MEKSMNKRLNMITVVLTLGLSLLFSSVGLAQKNRDTAVTTSIEGTGVLPDPTVFNYRIQSDLLGPYHNGIDSVGSVLQSGGDWQLETHGSAVRSILLDFRDAVPNSNPSPPFAVGQAPTKVETKSYLLYGSGK